MSKRTNSSFHALLGGSCMTRCTQNGTWALQMIIQWGTTRAAHCGILTIWEIKRWMKLLLFDREHFITWSTPSTTSYMGRTTTMCIISNQCFFLQLLRRKISYSGQLRAFTLTWWVHLKGGMQQISSKVRYFARVSRGQKKLKTFENPSQLFTFFKVNLWGYLVFRGSQRKYL